MQSRKDKHRGHPKRIVEIPRSKKGPGQHLGFVECILCKEFVNWASKDQIKRSKIYD